VLPLNFSEEILVLTNSMRSANLVVGPTAALPTTSPDLSAILTDFNSETTVSELKFDYIISRDESKSSQ